MLSITPAITRKPSLGRPKRLNSSQEWYSGWGSMATLYPACSSTREMMARPNEG